MELSAPQIIKAFKCNFPFKITESVFGPSIEMPSKEAFLFSSVTGAGYLENPIYPFTPKGLLKLFYNVFNYDFVTGIFDNLSFRHTPLILSKAKKYIFSSEFKYVVPVEFYSEVELQSYLEKKFELLEHPENYLVLRVELSKKGNGMEPFMEYLASEYFRKKGFIVENQIPLAHSLGTPDFGGYLLKETFNALRSSGVIRDGFHVIELALLRIFQNQKNSNSIEFDKCIVGEAKTSPSAIISQLEKYLDTGIFDFGIEINPSRSNASKEYFGLLTLDSNFNIVYKAPKDIYKSDGKFSKEKYIEWLNNYMKYYAVANLTNDEFQSYFFDTFGRPISSKQDISNFINNQSMSDILKRIPLKLEG